MSIEQSLHQSFERGFIDRTIESPLNYRPQLLLNNDDQQVLPMILQELNTCEEFSISVAFITESGLAMLKTVLYELALKGIKGRIITSTYLNFNNPKVFIELLKLKNVEVRLTNLEGFHAKGYYFKQKLYSTFIIGSSNLTGNALKKNYEWNVKLTTLEHGELINEFHNQFEMIWKESMQLDLSWIQLYEEYFEKQQRFNVNFKLPATIGDSKEQEYELTPNLMQQSALKEIAELRESGERKGIVISATGTGKTYLSAFEVKAFKPKRLLFIVHREQILKKAMLDYQKILGGNDSDYGLLSGTFKETTAKYLFATIQSMSKDQTLSGFSEDEFDYIIIDEVHKAGAGSYLKVMNYFKPLFLLGMTATPERTDDINIYGFFDFNIAYEIRLQEALEADMLCPFHYFGITDYELNGEIIEETTDFKYLVSKERVNYILEKADYYGYSGEKLKGLVFCSSKNEAYELAELFTENGFKSIALTGDDSQKVREDAVKRLENGMVCYLFTVDIFNEGIDIPVVNQIIMLRQTQSSIIFLQQLGRGLRKHKEKEFVTIIDFIGNYKNNYLIPIALSGDNTLNKDNLRRNTVDMKFIKGVSTVNFEEVAKQRIFDSISNTKLSSLKNLKDAYFNLKDRIGYSPLQMDFIKNNLIDPLVIVKEYDSYHRFLKKIKENNDEISEYEEQVLVFLSTELMNGKRSHELLLLQYLLNNEVMKKEDFISLLKKENSRVDEDTLKSVEIVLNLSFYTNANIKKYGNKEIVNLVEDEYVCPLDLSNKSFKDAIQDIINVGLYYTNKYDQKQKLTVNEKYSRKDVCRLLNWKKDMTSTVYGYKLEANTCPLFITYHKDDKLSTNVHYGDELLNPEILKWYSRTPRSLRSPEIQKIINAKENRIDISLFIQKKGAEGTDFYYLGELDPIIESAKEEIVKNKDGNDVDIISIEFHLKNTMKNSVYEYIKNE